MFFYTLEKYLNIDIKKVITRVVDLHSLSNSSINFSFLCGKEKILIAKVNIDENPEIPSNYGIMSIPTLILFKNGKSVSSQIGLVEKSSLTKWIDENL